MTQGSTEVVTRSLHRSPVRHLPRQFGQRSRWRFGRERRKEYLSRVAGVPTPWQAATIETLLRLEWSALECEHRIGDLKAAREAREHRRLLQRLLADFERSMPPAPAERPMTALDYARILADRERAGAAELPE